MFPEEPPSHNYLRLVSLARTRRNFQIGPKLGMMLNQIIDDCHNHEIDRLQLGLSNLKILLRLLGSLPFQSPVSVDDLIRNIETNQRVLQMALDLARPAGNQSEIAEIEAAIAANDLCAEKCLQK
jgi:hypothetical protein